MVGKKIYFPTETASTYFSEVPLLGEVDSYGNVVAYGPALTVANIQVTTASGTITESLYETTTHETTLDVVFDTTVGYIPSGTITIRLSRRIR